MTFRGNLSWINILNFFFKIWTGFCNVNIFLRPNVIFYCMSSVGKMNISLTILVLFESRRFRKNFFDFSNNTFPIQTGIINLFHYIWGIWFIHKKHLTSMTVLKFDNLIKKSRYLDYYFGNFWKILCSTTLMQSFIARG